MIWYMLLVQSSWMQWSTLAELTGIQDDPSKRPIAALFLAMPPSPKGKLVQLHEEVPALLMDLRHGKSEKVSASSVFNSEIFRQYIV